MIRDNHDRTKTREKRTKHEGTVHERREREKNGDTVGGPGRSAK
jgi:hypothetical protein